MRSASIRANLPRGSVRLGARLSHSCDKEENIRPGETNVCPASIPGKHAATREVNALRESLRISEAARLASETRLRLILESAQDFAIVTTGSEGDITTWSPGARAIFGYEEADVIGQNVRLLFTPEDQANGRSSLNCVRPPSKAAPPMTAGCNAVTAAGSTPAD